MEPAEKSADGALRPGLVGRAVTRVTEPLTAPALGSGSIAVYATPAMVALMEQSSVDCVDRHLAAGQATVGIHIDVTHKSATPPGLEVVAEASLTAVEGRKLTFSIVARDAAGPIGEAVHTRLIVDVERFRTVLEAKLQQR